MKLEQKVACGPDLQNYVTLDYLDLQQCSYFRYMKFYFFLGHVSHIGFDLLVEFLKKCLNGLFQVRGEL